MATPPLAIAGRASFSPMSPSSRTVSANTSLPPRRRRQRSTNSPCSIFSPIAARPNTTISQSRSEASSARSMSMRLTIRARSNRMVSCGSQERCAPALRLQGDIELRGGTGRAIDFFGCRRRQRQPRSLACRDIDIKTVAAGNAAGGVDEHARQPFRFGRGKAHAQRAGFMQIAAAGDAVLEMHAEPAPRPGRGWPRTSPNSRACYRSASVPQTQRPIRPYSAIWRLISAGSRLARSQAYFTAPRSMTAKLSPSSQAKSRYCSTSTIAMLPRLRR